MTHRQRATQSAIPVLHAQSAHSAMGILSFAIALLIAASSMLVISTWAWQMAKVLSLPKTMRASAYPDDMLGFAMLGYMTCINVPLSIVGLGMAVVDLVWNRMNRHSLTWLALFGNGLVTPGFFALLVLKFVVKI